MKIAIIGATSQIARDLIISFAANTKYELTLFARRPEVVTEWLEISGLSNCFPVSDFDGFNSNVDFDAIINCVGVGDPARAVLMGPSIFEVTLKYDGLVLDYLKQHPNCRYIFLSSGAVYGSNFDMPIEANSRSSFAINEFQSQDWYGIAKLHAECRHRAFGHFHIVDIRVFNYFSHTQDLSAQFFITDLLRAIKSGKNLITSPNNIVRDYIGPKDFFQLISKVLLAEPVNDVVDCYTRSPVEKITLLSILSERFGLRYQVVNKFDGVNASGVKTNYYSNNRRAELFGYQPLKNSLDSILDEASLVL